MDKKAVEEVRKFKEEVEKHMPLEAVILFGSRAGDAYGKDSDIDLIIVSPRFERLGFFKRVRMMYDYWRPHYPVDFVCYTPKEFDALKRKVSIVGEALRDGVVV